VPVSEVKTSRREMYAALTRSAVLDAAKTLFVADGFEATSVDGIAGHAQASKGAVYHHFRDKREIFTEVFRVSQEAIFLRVIEAMSSDSEEDPWQRVEAATRLFLRSYASDDAARALLRQAMGALGWERVRALDEEAALPFLRATLEDFVTKGHARPVPIDATVQIFFSLFCNAILYTTDAAEPVAASREAETVVFTALEGLKARPPG
jgi:AcrR family transcriptional regulator